MVSTYWSTIKLRKMFQQITQKWCATETWDLKNLFMWLRIHEIYHICELWTNYICEHFTVVWICSNFCRVTWQCKVYYERKSFCNSQNASDVIGAVSHINFTKLTSFKKCCLQWLMMSTPWKTRCWKWVPQMPRLDTSSSKINHKVIIKVITCMLSSH